MEPVFVSTDVDQITTDILNRFEELTGRVLQPAHVERLLLNVLAYRESLVREAIQYSATQNLVDFAVGQSLDYLGALVGVVRLPASPAITTLEFNLVPGHVAVIIPSGTRVASVDGLSIFRTDVDKSVIVGVDVAEIPATCITTGSQANGYIAGNISNLLDPLSYIQSVANTTETAGGASIETDERLKLRIKLAPGQFSNAGSRAAYKFFSLTASPSIIDVAVESVDPGTVQIYPLMEDGTLPTVDILDLVYASCNDEKVRPLTDLVTVLNPTIVDYTLDFELTLYDYADETDTVAAVQAVLDAFIFEKRKKLGLDLVENQFIAKVLSIAGVYQCESATPFTDTVLASNEYGVCSGIVLTVIGTTVG